MKKRFDQFFIINMKPESEVPLDLQVTETRTPEVVSN
jgi:hypothetical protein